MKTINVPTRNQVDEKSQVIFDNLKKNLGIVPNLYATIGYSSDVLEGYLTYSAIVGSKSFTKKEIEAIKLAVSEVNDCQYCKAAHTAIAKMNGFTESETVAIRSGHFLDEKLNTLVVIAQEIANKRGKISQQSKDKFFELGYEEQAFIDLIAVVNVVSFTNFVHNATEVPVDFPEAPVILRKTA